MADDLIPGAAKVITPVQTPVAPADDLISKEAPKSEPKEKMVTIPEGTLNTLLARLDSLETTQKHMLQVEDSNKLQKIDDLRRQGKLVKSVKVLKMDGKHVIGWKLKEDEVYFSDGKLIEKQSIEVFFSDKTQKVLSMRQWSASQSFEVFEVTGETKESDGQVFLKIRNTDGLALEIGLNYVN
jgi:hypothetical protein